MVLEGAFAADRIGEDLDGIEIPAALLAGSFHGVSLWWRGDACNASLRDGGLGETPQRGRLYGGRDFLDAVEVLRAHQFLLVFLGKGLGVGQRLAVFRLDAHEGDESVSLAGTGRAGLVLFLVKGQEFSQGHIRQAAGFYGMVDFYTIPPAFQEVLAGLLQASR